MTLLLTIAGAIILAELAPAIIMAIALGVLWLIILPFELFGKFLSMFPGYKGSK